MSVNPLVKYEIAIQQCYSKYKTFVNDNSLPKLIVKFHNGKNENIDYLAQMEAEDLYNQRYILHFDYMLFAIMDNTEIASILFHEFTHLTDSLSLRVLPYAKFKIVMQLYSEIHAYEIELGRALDLQNLNNINFNTVFKHYDKEITLGDFIQKNSTVCSKTLSNAVANCNPETIISDLRKVSRYIANIAFVRKYINPEYTVNYIEIIPEIFRKDIITIAESYLSDSFRPQVFIQSYNSIEELYYTMMIRKKLRNSFSQNQLTDDDLEKLDYKNYKKDLDKYLNLY